MENRNNCVLKLSVVGFAKLEITWLVFLADASCLYPHCPLVLIPSAHCRFMDLLISLLVSLGCLHFTMWQPLGVPTWKANTEILPYCADQFFWGAGGLIRIQGRQDRRR